MQVFDNDDFPPDAEFGCFQMVNGPPDTDFVDQALLRLDVGEPRGYMCCVILLQDIISHLESLISSWQMSLASSAPDKEIHMECCTSAAWF